MTEEKSGGLAGMACSCGRIFCKPHAAEHLMRGRKDQVLAEQHDKDLMAVIRFSGQKTLQARFHAASQRPR